MTDAERIAKALAFLEQILERDGRVYWLDGNVSKTDLVEPIAEAVGYLRGYALPPDVLARYVCGTCGARDVKLWRAVHDASRGWCAKCAMAQAGYPDVIDDRGKHEAGDYGPSDQVYSPAKGQSLLPWVPAPDGAAWCYTSVPPEGCVWWRELPTR